ncbi:uncharacterized protein RHOBADRAFT_53213 [Rhodotorula graminis WP1]|uniref:CST complex subunit Stn1 N-terminal domain-containing protein n=1 Tax=Rhodotorula graminis (strain WP1) TaxID=578459 RepID=A0A194S3N1_RHOGW|nr:uncharacterized protein RHOBADRAFT_53213 [Rhodotorula graminis WP1]KPV75202.1 hypothetical protein RHOBADRAFT_53213 [Rhodotorula graminis WP1]
MAQPRTRTSTRTSSRSSAPSSSARRPPPAPPAASLPLPASIRGGEGFYPASSSAASTSTSARPSTGEPLKRPTGVPRPPTSSRPRTLRPTVPRSPASSQESLIIVEPASPHPAPAPPRRPATKRTTTPSLSPSPSRSTTPTPTLASARSTTPTYDPLPPSSSSTSTVRRPLPPSCFRPRPPSPPPRPRSPSPEVVSPSPRKRPRLRPSSPSSATAPFPADLSSSLVPALRDTDFTALDPASTYRLDASLLFRAEYLELGAPTFAQGGKRGYGGAAATKWERDRARARAQAGAGRGGGATRDEDGCGEVPRWARTDDDREWEEDVLQRLSSRLAAPTTTTASTALVPLLFAADVARLRGPVRLGEAGAALECYVVGREWPVRTGVWTGWVVAKEWREKENSWVYAVDDGTDVLEVVCPSSSFSPSSSLPGTTSAAQLPLFLSRPSTSSTTSATTSSAAVSPRKALAAAQFGHLEQRAEQQSERVEVREGECVRVVGRVEERRMVWDEGRRVVALRMDILDDVNALSMHHTQAAQLHRTLYALPFDARTRLAQVERDELEARQAAWETASCATATTSGTGGGSEWGGRGGGSVASSPGRGTHYRPTRPSKLAREDLTLSNFIIYVRHHLRKRYVVAIPFPGSPTDFDMSPPPSSQRSPSSSSPSSSTSSSSTSRHTAELALPFTLAAIQANAHLSLFASRLAQEQARVARDKERGVRPGAATRAWVAPPPMGSGRGAQHVSRGSVGMGAARLLPPPSASSSTSSSSRRSRAPLAPHEHEPPLLEGAELERAIARVWREAIRTMRKAGMVVEAEDATARGDETVPAGELGGKVVEDELPDLPRWERGRGAPALAPQTPRRRAGRVGEDEDEGTPRAAQPAGGCPWGDVKLFGPDEEDEDPSGQDGLGTPRASRALGAARIAPPPVTPARPKAHGPTPTWSASSGTSSTSSSTAQAQQSFQLVTAGSLAPLLLTVLSTLFDHRRRPDKRSGAPPPSSVRERDLRVVLHGDERWAAVAQYSEAVGKALEVLASEGRVERHGLGWRPSGMGRGR